MDAPYVDQNRVRRRDTLGSVIDNGRMSVSDTAKKILQRLSASVSNNKVYLTLPY